MTRANDLSWRDRAHALATAIADEHGSLSPQWRAALEQTPRHAFVPRFYVQQDDGTWATTSADSSGWLDAVYRNEPLITSLAPAGGGQLVTASSSSKPGLMARMLETLDVQDGHRVLEIGTGTGYNAALLAHRLGSEHVFSVDIDTELVDTARRRLAEIGPTPTLAATDGADGFPAHAPYDRIIATCSVPTVPWAWAEQLADDGLVLVDLKRSTHAGNLVLLRKHSDRLEGRFLPKWAGFMAIRHDQVAPENAPVPDVLTGRTSVTKLSPEPWTALVPWFLAHAELPRGIMSGYLSGHDGRPEWATMTAPDGSWCAVATQPSTDGTRKVRQSGPTAIWDTYEHVHRTWEHLGSPGWDRLGLTVFPDGGHQVWLDEPDSDIDWNLP